MPELINRQAALEIAMSYCPDDDGCCSKADHDLREMLDEIEAIPETKAKPVRYGRWKQRRNGKYYCTNCGREEKFIFQKNYCPRCGSDMREEYSDNAELKRCPFCDGKAELRQEDFDPRWMPTRNDPDSGGCPPYYVKCEDCGANTEYRYDYPDAIKLWNRRF